MVVSHKDVSVLGLKVLFNVRMVRSNMTLTTSKWVSCYSYVKRVFGVASITLSYTTIPVECHNVVTLLTTSLCSNDWLPNSPVGVSIEPERISVLTLCELLNFFGVTHGTVFGCWVRSYNWSSGTLEGVSVGWAGTVAHSTTDTELGVFTLCPLFNDLRGYVLLEVTLYTSN